MLITQNGQKLNQFKIEKNSELSPEVHSAVKEWMKKFENQFNKRIDPTGEKKPFKLASLYVEKPTTGKTETSESDNMSEGKQAKKAEKKLADYMEKTPRDLNAIAAKTRSGAGAHKTEIDKPRSKIKVKDIEKFSEEVSETSSMTEMARIQQLAGIKILKE